VACNFSNQVAVIDLGVWKVEKMIEAGKFSDGLAMAR
jgi:hypothetical protein